jgi:hypothetical protein
MTDQEVQIALNIDEKGSSLPVPFENETDLDRLGAGVEAKAGSPVTALLGASRGSASAVISIENEIARCRNPRRIRHRGNRHMRRGESGFEFCKRSSSCIKLHDVQLQH